MFLVLLQAWIPAVSTSSNDFETTSRRVLVIGGGRSVVSAAALIDLLYIDAMVAVPFALPFKVVVADVDVEVLFDEIEPKALNPMLVTATSVRQESFVSEAYCRRERQIRAGMCNMFWIHYETS